MYREVGGRVSAIEGVVRLQSTDGDNHVGVNLTLDTLSGGSPNGAIPSHGSQTFSSPSGNSLTPPSAQPVYNAQTCTTPSGNVYDCSSSSTPHNSLYMTAPGALPLDKSFQDKREAINMNWDHPMGQSGRYSLGSGYSHETDFQSMSVNGGLTGDFFQKNITLFIGANLEFDRTNPIGGTPVPLTDYAQFRKQGNQTKNVQSYMLGLTQVMTRRWLTQLNVSADIDRGYQNDPYKVVSGLDATGNVVGYIFENRPTNRNRRGIFWENKLALDRDTIDVSYRFMHDDWGIVSHTAGLSYRFQFGGLKPNTVVIRMTVSLRRSIVQKASRSRWTPRRPGLLILPSVAMPCRTACSISLPVSCGGSGVSTALIGCRRLRMSAIY